MNAVELRMPSGVGSGVWACGKCRVLQTPAYSPIADASGRRWTEEERNAYAQRMAEQCCNYRCVDCGEPAKQHHQRCTMCGDKWQEQQSEAKNRERFANAKQLTVAEWDGCMLFDASSDKWFHDLDEAEEWYADDQERERPAFLWMSKRVHTQPDFSGRLLDTLDEYDEDAGDRISRDAIEELDAFEKVWWERNEPISYTPDFKRCLILPSPSVGE